GFIGKKLCPDLVFVKHNWMAYKEASNKVRAIVGEYDPNYTTMSLDEVYLDITLYLQQVWKLQNMDKSGSTVAEEIRRRVFESTQLTASAGIACNRMLAKICSDKNKPNGQYQLAADARSIKEFMETLPVRKIPGIGKVTERILKEIGCEYCGDVTDTSRPMCAYIPMFFKSTTAHWLFRACFGIGTTERDLDHVRVQKSISNERTFRSTNDVKWLEDKCTHIARQLTQVWLFVLSNKKKVQVSHWLSSFFFWFQECQAKNIRGKTITVKIKTNDFDVRTRAHSMEKYTNDTDTIVQVALEVMRKEYPFTARLLGVRLSHLEVTEPERKSQRQLADFFKVEEAKHGPCRHALHSDVDVQAQRKNIEPQSDLNSRQKPEFISEPVPKTEPGLIPKLGPNKPKSRPKTKENNILFFLKKTNEFNASTKHKRTLEESNNETQTREGVVPQTDVHFITANKKSKSFHATQAKEVFMYTCPVCNTFQSRCNLQLNMHLNTCLAEVGRLHKNTSQPKNNNSLKMFATEKRS
ncbi:DNA polymerase IV / kappa, partial [Reticulomyxa filosa]